MILVLHNKPSYMVYNIIMTHDGLRTSQLNCNYHYTGLIKLPLQLLQNNLITIDSV